MKHSLALIIVTCGLLAASTQAAEEADPAMAVLKRMREQLRTVMIQQQKTEAERAVLQAANMELESKVKTQESSFKKLAKESNEQKDADAKTIGDLKARILVQQEEQAQLQNSLAKWKQGHQEMVHTAQKTEAQRAELSARVILLNRKVADHQRKNDELFKIGTEVLSKYEGFGLGTAIAAREPFTRNMRVKLETLVQDYNDKLVDNKIKPDEAPKAVSKEAAARVQAPAR